MREYTEIALWIIGVILCIWLFITVIAFTGTLPDKHTCEDLDKINSNVISEVRFGFLFIPYNHCSIRIDNLYYSIWDYQRLEHAKAEGNS